VQAAPAPPLAEPSSPGATDTTVLVLGGYGFFGRRLVSRLAAGPGLRLIVAGRSLAAAGDLVARLAPAARSELHARALDARSPSFADALGALAPDVVVDASGPFQGADHRVAAACIAGRAHYIDLADGREFVAGIGALDEAARDAGVSVVSGASTVPALSSAAVTHLARDLSALHSIDIGISPGNRTERGLSTVRGILTYCGRPIPSGNGATTFGWIGSWRHAYPAPVGSRLLSPCDVPDLVLLPAAYPGGPAVRFGAGLELEVLHRGLNAMAWMARLGLVRDWSRHARILARIADLFRHRGTDAGAMHVTVHGEDRAGAPVSRTWQLTATAGDGPYVPTLAATALVRKLQAGVPSPGARPCVDLLELADFERASEGLAIRTAVIA
jgi:hypothetical protein